MKIKMHATNTLLEFSVFTTPLNEKSPVIPGSSDLFSNDLIS